METQLKCPAWIASDWYAVTIIYEKLIFSEDDSSLVSILRRPSKIVLRKCQFFIKKKTLTRYIRLPAGILWSLPSKSSIPLHLQSRLTYHCRLELIRSHVLAGKRIYLQERILRFESKEPSVSKETDGFPKKTVGLRDWAEKASTTVIYLITVVDACHL